MTRSFLTHSVPTDVFMECVDVARRSPSAGNSQGWNLLVWSGSDTHRYWDIAFPSDKRQGFAFPKLLSAPLIALVLADRGAYLERYSEPDKAHQMLGESADNWVAPYWTIDASFATMTLMLALHDRGLGTLFFAHARETELRETFGIPDSVEIVGVLAVGYPDAADKVQGRSADRARKPANDIIHRDRW
jgi:nitroreductase